MSYIIGMVSQKGGAGKSTLARLFARELAKDGFEVKIADLDTQQTTCTTWASERSELGHKPEIRVEAIGNIQTALQEAKNFDAYILDGQPHSSDQSATIAKCSDLIVIPTGQTKDDLRPAVNLANDLADRKGISPKKIAFALVRTTDSDAEINAAFEYLKQTDYTVLNGWLPMSTAYGKAHDIGKTVTETSFKTLNEKAEKLAQSIIDRLGEVTTEPERESA